MPKIRFTDLTINSLKEGTYFDDRTHLGIRIGKSRKTWFVVKEPNRTKLRLGHYPQMTLKAATAAALIARGTPHHISTAPIFLEARAQYLDQGKWKPKTRYETTRTLTKYFYWQKTLDKITHHDVLEVIENIKAPSEAAHVFRDIAIFFSWCVPRYLKTSPCAGLKPRAKYTPRDRVLSDEEIVSIWKSCDQLGTFGIIIKLCITTGLRVGEISQLRREWLRGNKLIIPSGIAKNSRQHVIPLSKLSLSLIEQINTLEHQSLYFAANNSKGYLNFSSKIRAKLNQLSRMQNFTIHDIRRYFAVSLQKLGARLETVEVLLGHITGSRSGIVRVYQQYDWQRECAQALEKYEAHLIFLLATQ